MLEGKAVLINDKLEEKGITKYRLSKLSGVPQATINDICSGKTDLDKCNAGTLCRIAKALGITAEEILESENTRSADWFKRYSSRISKELGD